MAKLNKHTAELIADRLEQLQPENFGEDWSDWELVHAAMVRVNAAGTVEALQAEKIAADELYSVLWVDEYIGGTYPSGRSKLTAPGLAIEADLCRAGFFERHDAGWVRNGGVVRTRTVDGVRYNV